MNPILSLNPPELSEPSGFAHLTVTRRSITVHIAGQVAYDSAGQVVGINDLAAQTTQIYKNLATALANVGATFQDVVKTTLYVRDLNPEKAHIIRAARAPFFSTQHLPASTMVGVASLTKPELLLEVDALAMLEESN